VKERRKKNEEKRIFSRTYVNSSFNYIKEACALMQEIVKMIQISLCRFMLYIDQSADVLSAR